MTLRNIYAKKCVIKISFHNRIVYSRNIFSILIHQQYQNFLVLVALILIAQQVFLMVAWASCWWPRLPSITVVSCLSCPTAYCQAKVGILRGRAPWTSNQTIQRSSAGEHLVITVMKRCVDGSHNIYSSTSYYHVWGLFSCEYYSKQKYKTELHKSWTI